MTVTPELEAIEDYLLTKLGKYDKRADRWARQPRNGKEWYERAYDYYHAERFEDAAAAFKRAADERYRIETSLYNASCSYALLGDADRALVELDKSIREGWDDIEQIAEDSDFDPIRSDPRFARVVAERHRDEVTRRVQETMQRYADLKEGRRQSPSIENTIGDAIREGVHQAFGHKVGLDNDWFDVGLDLLRLRRLDESIEAFQRSIAQNGRPATSMYNIACAYSLKGDARNGMAWLDKAIEEGFSGDEKLENDPDIALLRKQPGFTPLRAKAKDLVLNGGIGKNDWIDFLAPGNRWRNATVHHRQVTDRYPRSGRAWFNLGYSSIKAKEYAQAIDAFRRAIELGHRRGTSSYNIACVYALQGQRDAAFQWLARAHDAGFDLHGYLKSDSDLRSLRRDPRFKELLRGACEHERGEKSEYEHDAE